MAVGGTWAAQNLYFSGAAKWGTGIDPIHSVRDEGRGRQYTPDPADSLADVPEAIVADHQTWGYGAGDYYAGEAEAGARMVHDHPGWGEHPKREAIPGNYPVPGEPGAAGDFRAIPHRSREEAAKALATFGRGATGGWQNKVADRVNDSVTSSPEQYELNTSMRQGPQVGVMQNTRAVARGSDAPRSPIRSRVAGMVVKVYAKSFEQGGGRGSPRMYPYQTSELRRPFYFRGPALPPGVNGAGQMEGRVPYSYVAPARPDPGSPATSSGADSYGYTEGDYY